MADLVSILATTVVGAALVLFLGKKWFEARVQQSVKHVYDLKLEQARESALVKAKAQLVAELFAEWISFPEDQRRLNQLTLEAFLWLPAPILHELSQTLSNKPDSPGVRALIVKVRDHLIGANALPAHEVIIFQQQNLQRLIEQSAKKDVLRVQAGGPQQSVPGDVAV